MEGERRRGTRRRRRSRAARRSCPPPLPLSVSGKRGRESEEREEGVRRRIRKEKWKLLYIFDSLDSNEKRKKQGRSEKS